METTTALALIPQSSAYEPRDMSELRLFAKDMADSKLTKVRSAQQAQLIIVTGHELGIPPAASLRMIYVADFGDGDQATISADGMVAVCLSHPDRCEYFRCEERSEKGVTYVTKRRGGPEERETFGPDDRDRAKLGKVKDGKDASLTNWAKYPVVMMGHRAASILARRVFPDLLGGMYTPDEAEEIADNNRGARSVTTADVQPLRAATAPVSEKIVDADFTDKPSDEDRVVSGLKAATTKAEVDALAKEALRVWPNGRPDAVKTAHVEAKKRVTAPPPAANVEPPHDPATGEVTETAAREPGSDDE